MPDENSEKTRGRLELYDVLETVAAALVICVITFVFAVRIVDVDGSSMYPTLYDRDKLIVSNLFFKPEQGDIVVLKKADFMDQPIVKRVIAVGGQTVNIDFDSGTV
jgi:signal peptidase I